MTAYSSMKNVYTRSKKIIFDLNPNDANTSTNWYIDGDILITHISYFLVNDPVVNNPNINNDQVFARVTINPNGTNGVDRERIINGNIKLNEYNEFSFKDIPNTNIATAFQPDNQKIKFVARNINITDPCKMVYYIHYYKI